MNKGEFIEQLKQSIGILDDQEQQYFVEEYTQHIEMKMSQGMSEEEAVKAMGSIEELSKEILASYHVKTDLNEQTAMKKSGGNKFFAMIKHQADKIYGKIAESGRKMSAGLKNLFKKKTSKPESGKSDNQAIRIGISKCMSFIGRMINKCFYIVLWCLLLMWNCFLIGCGLFGVFILACAIFAIGVLLVMVVQGYPLIGTMIATLGGTLSVAAFTVACFILTKWKISKKAEGGEAHA